MSPFRQYRCFRRAGRGRFLSAAVAVLGCLIWIAITGSTKRKIPIRSKKAEAARQRSAEIDDWSEVVDRDR